MKKITIIASAETFENLSTFETIEQLNETVREYKSKYLETLSNTELTLIDNLHRYSAKYKGVSFLCKNKLAELIGKSRRTVIRACQRLEALGIIRQYAMKRASDMQQTSNAIVIQPVKLDDVVQSAQRVTSRDSANVTQEVRENVTPVKQIPSKTNTIINNTYTSVYVRFKEFVANFVNDRKLTNKLYGIYLAQTSYIRDCYETSDLLNTGLQALKIAFVATKRKKLRNIAGYYHGTLDRLLDRLYADLIFD
ncbi:helix-turn-helix domain-containing protein [Neobacillus sp. M.A.Huq-85]